MAKNAVSVVVPVYNNALGLKKCLAALTDQSYPRDRYEVVVVDNGSSDDIRAVTEIFQHIRYEREERKGSYAARNKGIESSIGSILAFTDSDCVPHKDWLGSGVAEMLGRSACSALGGRIDFLYAVPDRPTVLEYYDSSRNFRQSWTIENEQYAATANLFIRRDVIDDVGGFKEDRKSRGDKEWCQRAVGRGHRICYSDEAIVTHPARQSMEQIVDKHLRLSGGIFQENKDHDSIARGMIKAVVLGLVPPVEQTAAMLRDEDSKGMRSKLFLIQWSMKLLHMMEYGRLLLGGEPRR